jgi:hypothetical protein
MNSHPATPPKNLPKTATQAFTVFFQHRSPQILAIFVLLAAAFRLGVGDFGGWDAATALLVLLGWPINEWLIHTQILHHRPRDILGLRWDYRIAQDHRQHHQDPWNLHHVFISLHVYVWAVPLLLAVALGLGWLFQPAVGATFLLTYAVLALHYEFVHYLAHIQWVPHAYYAGRVREHRLHHFRHERRWWGVSTGWGDVLLGTAPDPATVEKSGRTAQIVP